MLSGAFRGFLLVTTLWHFSDALSSTSRFDASTVKSKAETKPMPSTRTVDMGQDKLVNIFIPPEEQHDSSKRGSGDVLGRSSMALARMVAHCPNLITDRNVLELGCGLGLVSATVCKHARPNHVAMTDSDRDALALAYATCTRLQRSRASVSRCNMDWSDQTTWPNQDYSLVLASDVLYEQSCILPLTRVLKHYLASSGNENSRKRALIVDPVEQVNRDAFCFAANKAGLEVETSEFPGMSDFMLLDIFSLD